MRTNFLMEDEYIRITRGDTFSFNVVLVNAQTLTEAYFTVTKSANVEPLFQKRIGRGITKIGSGEYCVRVAPADTAEAEVGKYFYDLEITVGEDRFTVLKGVFEIEQDYT